MTIYEIKERTAENQPYYFSKDTMKFFGQTLKDFKVYKQSETEYLITAPSYWSGKFMGNSQMIFHSDTNQLKSL
tara:strand:+ start:38 stop:259 length:222 start_codon:yes stop_codon:yes gene_type:complete